MEMEMQDSASVKLVVHSSYLIPAVLLMVSAGTHFQEQDQLEVFCLVLLEVLMMLLGLLQVGSRKIFALVIYKVSKI
jgi:hypothetical protein